MSVGFTAGTRVFSEDPTLALQQAFIPAGAVMSFAMSAAPMGWLACDGSEVSRDQYSNLFAAIGTIHGPGNSFTTFNVPDLRGEFIRGWDNGRAIDTGRTFGANQIAYAGENTYSVYRDDGDAQGGTVGSGFRGEVSAFSVNGTAIITTASANSTTYTQTVSTIPNDTRPRNVALLYCIKY